MIETFWRRHRGPMLLGFAGFVLLGSFLTAAALLIAAVGHCSDCDPTPFLLRSFGFSFLIAAAFGLVVAFGAAGLRWMLVDYLGRRPTNAVLVVAMLALVVLVAAPAFHAVQFLEYRVEHAGEEARLARQRDLCPDHSRHLSIIHDALPRPLPRETFVAEVRFEGTDVTPLYQGGARAEVTRVIQGDPAIHSLIVERLPSDRCDEAFENGTEGVVVMIPFDRPLGDAQRVRAIFVRRSDGYRLPDGFQIEEWQRPYWLRPPPRAQAGAPPAHSVTHAENGMAVTSVDGGEAVITPADPRTGDPIRDE